MFAFTGGQSVRRLVGVVLLAVGLLLSGIFVGFFVWGWSGTPDEGLHFKAVVIALLPLTLTTLGGGLLFFAVRANRREVRAFTHGRPVLARVTFRGHDESADFNGRHPFMIRWEFRGPDDEVFEGSLTNWKLLELEPFGEAKEIVVLYDPVDPRCNTLYVA